MRTKRRFVFTAVAVLAVFALSIWLRSRNTGRTLWLLGEQVAYWRVALQPWSDLPWHGPASMAGGYTLGPIYYWVLWADARIVSLFGPPLPHFGIICFAVLSASADVALMLAVAQRFHSVPLAVAVAVVLVSSPYQVTLDRFFWASNLAVVFVKLLLAIVLVEPPPSWRPVQAAFGVLVGWLALQAHWVSAPVVFPILLYLLLREWKERGAAGAVRLAVVSIAIVILLQWPMLTHLDAAGDSLMPSVVRQGLDGFTRIERWRDALLATMSSIRRILFEFGPNWLAATAICGAAVLVAIRYRRDRLQLVLLLGPLVTCLVLMVIPQGVHEQYWFSPVVPSVAVLIAAAVQWRPAGPVLLVIALAALPFRVTALRDRYAQRTDYGIMLQASRALVDSKTPISAIEAPWLQPTADPGFLYELLDGHYSPAGHVTVISPTGRISLR